jgi:DNA-binding HxlR family transcriptional regulator
VSRRSYHQYCATARTLDLVGERWTLLLIRELLTGPARFGDLLANLPGIGTGLLASRLKFLQEEGLVEPVTLPPPARTAAYGLTEAGEELEPVVLALARWGMRWAMAEPDDADTFRPGWAVLGLQAVFNPDVAAGVHLVYEFRVDDDVFHARVDDGTIESVHGPAQRPDVVLATNATAFGNLTAGRTTLTQLVKSGDAVVTGDRQAVRRMGPLFRRPAAADRVTP